MARYHSLAMETPGVVLVVSAHEPVTVARAWGQGALVVGRDTRCDLVIADAELSRRHCTLEPLEDGRVRVVDLRSHNGTFTSGREVTRDGVIIDTPAVLRVGGSVLLIEPAIERFAAGVLVDDDVVGPVLRVAYDAIERAAHEGHHLFLDGENGTGKERAARVFHAASRNKSGRFVAINCAMPEAMRPFVGAEGGVIFLDQVDALDPEAQQRVRERAEAVRDALVVTTASADEHYARVVLPPLRERRAEIPFLVAHTLAGTGLEPTAKLFEECLLRRWPANVRELVGAVMAAAHAARAAGADRVSGSDLPAWAGGDRRVGATTTPDISGLLPLVHPR